MELATANVLLARHSDGETELLPERPQSCRTCGLCGSRSQSLCSEESASLTPAKLSLPLRSLLLAVFGLYGVPLAGLVGGAVLAAAAGASDLVSAAGGFFGCFSAAFVMKGRVDLLEKTVIEQMSVHPSTAEQLR